MSLILDALNRSQRDLDNLETVPGLETIHPVEAMSSSSKIRVGLVVVLCCLATAAAIWLFMSMRDGSPVENTATTVSAESTSSIAPAPRVSPRSAASLQPVVTESVSVSSRDNVPKQISTLGTSVTETAQNDAVAALYKTPKPESVQGKTPTITPAVKQSDRSIDSAVESVPQVQNIDIDEVLSRAKAGLETVQLQEHSAPFITELSQQVKDSIPTIYYSIHDYSSEKASSYAVLNGKRVTAGASVDGNLRVEEILPDSIVLNIRGTLFRLKALNSWVNL